MATEVKRRRRRAAPAGIAPSEPERDILDQYLYEVSTYALLKGNEEIEVARKIRAGDQDALQELVKRNLRFVISVAKKYQNRGLPLIDLIGEGNVGLLTAARKFDPDQGVKFISYAVWWIRQAILSSLARQGRTVRVPLNRTADLSRIIKASEILRQKMRREPTPEELAKVTGLSVDVVSSLAALNSGDVRLDAPMDPDGDRSLIERFVADEMPDTEEEAMNRFLTDEIEQALGTLPPRDAKVLRLYFGLEGGREHTLEEIGSMLGVTRERVRQLRDRALKRLREGDVGRALQSWGGGGGFLSAVCYERQRDNRETTDRQQRNNRETTEKQQTDNRETTDGRGSDAPAAVLRWGGAVSPSSRRPSIFPLHPAPCTLHLTVPLPLHHTPPPAPSS
jgi:RNA polymerase primary sigma factor